MFFIIPTFLFFIFRILIFFDFFSYTSLFLTLGKIEHSTFSRTQLAISNWGSFQPPFINALCKNFHFLHFKHYIWIWVALPIFDNCSIPLSLACIHSSYIFNSFHIGWMSWWLSLGSKTCYGQAKYKKLVPKWFSPTGAGHKPIRGRLQQFKPTGGRSR